LKGLKYGAKVRILVPSRLAYGKNGNATFNVPSNAVLDTYITTLNYKTQTAIDEDRIKTFLAAKGLTASAIRDPSTGIYYIVTQLGTGASIIDKETGTAVVNYAGRYLDGTVFDSKNDGSYSTGFSVGALIIQGWKEIVPKFPAGSKIRFFLPSAYAYGIQGSVDQTTGVAIIPPNSVLDFDVEIVSVTN
jgi:FKBP-type peptidyl-prolyl cis-trans isomerase